MSEEQTPMVFIEDDAAARPVMKEVWVSRKGHHFLSERDARADGATHDHCKCGKPISLRMIPALCWQCRNEKERTDYEQAPRRAQTGDILYSASEGEYHSDWEEVFEYLSDNPEMKAEDLRLYDTEPNSLSEISTDVWEDVLPREDGDTVIPDAIYKALNELNRLIRAAEPVSWSPSKFAVTIPEDLRATHQAKQDFNAHPVLVEIDADMHPAMSFDEGGKADADRE